MYSHYIVLGSEQMEYEVFTCPEDYVKCLGNYCIPVKYICDGLWHCSNGEDEVSSGKHKSYLPTVIYIICGNAK